MNTIIDLCFMCTKDYNCIPVDDRVVSQVEYLLPEITVIKLGIPLRICSVCSEALYSFNKFKQSSVEVSRRLEASIRHRGTESQPTLLHSVAEVPQTHLQFQAVYIKEEQPDTDRSSPESINPLQRDALPHYSNNTENVYIKEELLDETTQDRTIYKSMLHKTVDDNKNSQIERSTKDKDFGITKEAEEIELNLLPVKSREKYEKEYDVFKNWLKENHVTVINEDVMLTYLQGKDWFYRLDIDERKDVIWSCSHLIKSTNTPTFRL